MTSFFSEKELHSLGIKKVGKNVLISKNCSLLSPEKLILGDNVRIDDFSLLSGELEIGNFVHISAYAAIFAKYGVKIGNFCGLSPRATIFSGSDDFSGHYLISPLVPEEFTNVHAGRVVLEDFCQIGTNSTVMPGITLREGSVIGAHSFVKENTQEWGIYAGVPCKFIKNREKRTKILGKAILCNQ